jgi:hypothetical protein
MMNEDDIEKLFSSFNAFAMHVSNVHESSKSPHSKKWHDVVNHTYKLSELLLDLDENSGEGNVKD